MARMLAFCAPLLVGNLFQQFYNLADSILVGRILGVRSFAAVGATGALSFLILGFALGICSGFSIPIAQSFGAGDMETVRSRAGQTVWLGVIFTALITGITFFWTDEILRLTRTPEEIFDDAYRYIFIVFIGTGFTILYNLASSVLRALGDSRSPLYFLIGAVTVNVFLDLLFMKVLGMGVEVRRMGYIASVGVPMGLQFSITAVGSIILQSAVNGLGADAVAAVSAGAKVHNIVAAPLETCGVAMATYCGQNLGAGKVNRIRQGMRSMTVVSFLYCGFAFLVNYFGCTSIAQLFLSSGETAILDDVRRYLVAMSCFYPELAIIFLFRNGLQGMGFSRQAMLAGLAELVARVLVAFGFVGRLGFRAVCFANPTAWVFADAILLVLYRYEIRKMDSSPEYLLRLMRGSAAAPLKRAAAK